MSKSHLSLLATTAILFGGCAIGPDYVRPDVKAPETFQSASASSVPSKIDMEWWKAFGDDRLKEAVETALSRNYDLQASQASVDAMLGQFDQAKSYLYPQINASGSVTRKSTENAAASNPSNLRDGVTTTYAASLSLASYEIDFFGKVRRANEAARASLLSSQYAKDAVRLSVTSAVAASYFKLASLQSQITLAKQNSDISGEILRMSELKYRHGVIAQTVLLQAESEHESALATLSQLEASRSAEEATFNILLGRNPQAVSVSDIESVVLPEVPSSLPSSLLENRPDIAQSEQNLVAANAKIGVAKAQYFPSIKLTGMLGVQSLELSQFVSNPTKLWELSPSISVPLFSAGRIAGEIKTAEADREQAVAAYKKSIVSAFNDADNAITQKTKITEQIRFQTNRADAIAKALEQAKLQYRVGTISYDSMLIVQQQWLQAQQSYLIAKQNGLITSVNLYKALGGGWNSDSSPLAIDYYPAGR